MEPKKIKTENISDKLKQKQMCSE